MESLRVFFRTCANVKTIGPSDRPFNLDKPTIILKCLKSLLGSLNGTAKKICLDIVDDSSGKDFLKKVENILKKYKFKYKIHELSVKNNGKSLEYCYGLADKTKEDLIYFCEDDYFHLPNFCESVFDAYDSKLIFSKNFAIFPFDYPGLYRKLTPSLLFVGKYNHWRSTNKTTGTAIIPSKLYRKYKKFFYLLAEFNKKGHGGEEESLNLIWENYVPCISPIPSLTAHLHKSSLPLIIDWKEKIQRTKI